MEHICFALIVFIGVVCAIMVGLGLHAMAETPIEEEVDKDSTAPSAR